jgi:hypothetical protein
MCIKKREGKKEEFSRKLNKKESDQGTIILFQNKVMSFAHFPIPGVPQHAVFCIYSMK